MFLASFPAGPWQTNCYVIAGQARDECVIIDPGYEAASGVREVIEDAHLKPVALILTHGHLDHLFSVAPLCRVLLGQLLDPPRRPDPAQRSVASHEP